MKSVRSGSASVHATMRGTTRNLNESTDSDSIASICSVALMLDRTAPIPEPTRPATSRPVTSGPISTKNASACTVGIHAVAPNVTRVPRVCSVRTAPSAKPAATIRGRDSTRLRRAAVGSERLRRGAERIGDRPQSEETDVPCDCQHVGRAIHGASPRRLVTHGQLRASSPARSDTHPQRTRASIASHRRTISERCPPWPEVSRSRLEATCRSSAGPRCCHSVRQGERLVQSRPGHPPPLRCRRRNRVEEDTWFEQVVLRTGRVVRCREDSASSAYLSPRLLPASESTPARLTFRRRRTGFLLQRGLRSRVTSSAPFEVSSARIVGAFLVRRRKHHAAIRVCTCTHVCGVNS